MKLLFSFLLFCFFPKFVLWYMLMWSIHGHNCLLLNRFLLALFWWVLLFIAIFVKFILICAAKSLAVLMKKMHCFSIFTHTTTNNKAYAPKCNNESEMKRIKFSITAETTGWLLKWIFFLRFYRWIIGARTIERLSNRHCKLDSSYGLCGRGMLAGNNDVSLPSSAHNKSINGTWRTQIIRMVYFH